MFILIYFFEKNKNYFLKLLKMFRTKKGINNNDQLSKIASNFFNTNESSTDECSNQKHSIYHLNQKTAPNIVILNNKTLSTHIPSIKSPIKKKFEYKKDNLIKEIINNDIISEKDKFKSLFDLANDNNLDKDLKDDINNEITNHNTCSLMSKNTLKKNCLNIKDYPLDDFIKTNILKKNKKKNSISINKLKIFNNNNYEIKNYNQRNDMKNREKKIFVKSNENQLNNSDFNYTINNIYKKSSKSHMKNNIFSVKKNIIPKNIYNSPNNAELKILKEKKLEKIIQIMNNNKSPSLNVNYFGKEKIQDNYLSILSNNSKINKNILTLQNYINFNNIINSDNKKYKKKFILKSNTYKKEKTVFYDINDIEDIKVKNRNHLNTMKKLNNINYKYPFSRRENLYTELNISTDNTSSEKKSSKKRMNHISVDSCFMNKNNNYQSRNIYENNIYPHKGRLNEKNYKILLTDVQKRMSTLVNNLINYIKILKKGK